MSFLALATIAGVKLLVLEEGEGEYTCKGHNFLDVQVLATGGTVIVALRNENHFERLILDSERDAWLHLLNQSPAESDIDMFAWSSSSDSHMASSDEASSDTEAPPAKKECAIATEADIEKEKEVEMDAIHGSVHKNKLPTSIVNRAVHVVPDIAAMKDADPEEEKQVRIDSEELGNGKSGSCVLEADKVKGKEVEMNTIHGSMHKNKLPRVIVNTGVHEIPDIAGMQDADPEEEKQHLIDAEELGNCKSGACVLYSFT